MEMYIGEYSLYLARLKSLVAVSTTREMLYELPVLSKVPEESKGRLDCVNEL